MPEGPRRRSPPLSRDERRALIDQGIRIHNDPPRPFTPDEVRAIVRAADRQEELLAEARAAMIQEQRLKEAQRFMGMVQFALAAFGAFILLAAAGIGIVHLIDPYFDGNPVVLGLVLLVAIAGAWWVAVRTDPHIGERPPNAADQAMTLVGGLILRVLAFAVIFPPFGAVMMFIEIPWRRLSHADIALALIVPLYGWIRFWTW